MAKRLVLFDVDGTLIHGGGIWAGSFIHALKAFFPNQEIPSIRFSGKTDYQIVQEFLEHWAVEEEIKETHPPQILDHYLNTVEKSIRTGAHHDIEVLSGVLGVLNHLNSDHRVRMGVLTGNVKRGLDLKLKYAELDRYFDFTVTGDDHWDRYQLPAIAQKRAAKERWGEFEGKEIVIIGDTIHDVNCGKSIGVKSIAVGTGRGVDQKELLDQNPDYYFSDLTDTRAIVKAILED